MTSGFESPSIFRKDSIYYLLGSDLQAGNEMITITIRQHR